MTTEGKRSYVVKRRGEKERWVRKGGGRVRKRGRRIRERGREILFDYRSLLVIPRHICLYPRVSHVSDTVKVIKKTDKRRRFFRQL